MQKCNPIHFGSKPERNVHESVLYIQFTSTSLMIARHDKFMRRSTKWLVLWNKNPCVNQSHMHWTLKLLSVIFFLKSKSPFTSDTDTTFALVVKCTTGLLTRRWNLVQVVSQSADKITSAWSQALTDGSHTVEHLLHFPNKIRFQWNVWSCLLYSTWISSYASSRNDEIHNITVSHVWHWLVHVIDSLFYSTWLWYSFHKKFSSSE